MSNAKREARKSLFVIGLMVGMLAAPHAYADPASPAQKQAPPAPAPKPSTPTPDAATRTKMALKLAGLVAFVANSCPKLKPDYARFKASLAVFGTSVEALEKPDIKAAYLGYTAQYRTDISGNCSRATAQFGPRGETIPGLFQVSAD